MPRAKFSYDPALGLAHLRERDPVLGAVIDRLGPFALQPRPIANLFEALLRSIIYQQLHARAAEAIHARVLAALRRAGAVSPEAVRALPDEPLRAAGLSAGKLRAVRDLADKCLAGTVPTLREARRLSGDDLQARLTQVRGIGPWTVHILCLFYLGHADILPTGDYAIRLAFKKLYRKRLDPTPAVILRHARRWEPYRSMASWYLWRSLDEPAEKVERKKGRRADPAE